MFDINKISLKNDKTWKLIQNGYTAGVFQLESELGKRWASQIKPSNINELSAVISLIRPACLEAGMTETYSKVKNGIASIPTYGDESVDKILAPTLGVLIYQEQLMKFGSEVAWSDMPYLEKLIIVDKLRKGIGKKDQKIINDLKSKFVAGCLRNGKSEELSLSLFTLIEGAGRYAFNDAHAKKYALWSYRTAYLKANYPYEFYCSYLTYSKGKQKPREEVSDLINEAKMRDIKITEPSVMNSNSDFKIIDDSIIFGLSHIKQVGESDAKLIELIRPKTFCDFLRLHFVGSESGKLRSLGVESLIGSGACDSYDLSRNVMMAVYSMLKELTVKELAFIFKPEHVLETPKDILDIVVVCANQQSIKKRKDIVLSEAKAINLQALGSPSMESMSEKALMGVSFTYDSNLNQIDDCSCKECFQKYRNNKNLTVRMTVKISELAIILTKKGKSAGKEMSKFKITDNTGAIATVCFPEQHAIYKNILFEDNYYEVTLSGTGNGWSVKTIKSV